MSDSTDSEATGPSEAPMQPTQSLYDPVRRSALRYAQIPLASGLALIGISIYLTLKVKASSTLVPLTGIAGVMLVVIAGLTPLMSYLQLGEIRLGAGGLSMKATDPPSATGPTAVADNVDTADTLQKLDRVLAELKRTAEAASPGVSHLDHSTNIRIDGDARETIAEKASSASSIVVAAVDRIRTRLLAEAEVLGRRINLNLVIGIATTFLALIMLAYLVFKATDHRQTGIDWQYVIPRLSLALFTEAFAFFFLRLYKSGLEDAKYYQNEISNVELWALGVQIAIESGKENSVEGEVQQLMNTERNFRLEKDQSTISLERERLQSRTGSEALEAVIAAFRK